MISTNKKNIAILMGGASVEKKYLLKVENTFFQI